MEEKIASRFLQQGHSEDAAISLFSAASCYKHAGEFARAESLADDSMALSNSVEFVKEIQQFRDECRKASFS